jgi:hypothetical protein
MATLAEISKAVRIYDPESKRQRRHGMASGAAGAGAVGLAVGGARGFERTGRGRKTRLRYAQVPAEGTPRAVQAPPSPWAGQKVRIYERPAGAKNPRTVSHTLPGDLRSGYAHARMGAPTPYQVEQAKKATRIKATRTNAKLAGAAGLAGLATYLYRRGESSGNRRWT